MTSDRAMKLNFLYESNCLFNMKFMFGVATKTTAGNTQLEIEIEPEKKLQTIASCFDHRQLADEKFHSQNDKKSADWRMKIHYN